MSLDGHVPNYATAASGQLATEAGRRLLALHVDHRWLLEDDFAAAILAIEQEARADLAARIVAAVEGVEVFELPTGDYVDLAAVLDAIREAAKPAATPVPELCGDCDGVGWVEGGKAIQTVCRTCKGSGEVRDE